MTKQESIQKVISRCSENAKLVAIHTVRTGIDIFIVPETLYLRTGETTFESGIEKTEIEYFSDYIRINGDIDPQFDKENEHIFDYDYNNKKSPQSNKRNIYILYDQIVAINEVLQTNWDEGLEKASEVK